jgi:hypothetical protein
VRLQDLFPGKMTALRGNNVCSPANSEGVGDITIHGTKMALFVDPKQNLAQRF